MDDCETSFLGATKHLCNWLCPLVGRSVGRLVTHSFDDPHVAPYWPCFPHISSNPHLSLPHGLSSSYLVHDVSQISFERLDDLRGDAVVDAMEEVEKLFGAGFAFEEQVPIF